MYEYNTKYKTICPSCGETYLKIKSYWKMCPSCYKKQNYTQESKSTVELDIASIIKQLTNANTLLQFHERQLRQKAEEVNSLKEQYETELEYWKNRYYREALSHSQSSSKNQLTQEVIQKMIRLCHPDKHGNSSISNEITQYLLTLRSK